MKRFVLFITLLTIVSCTNKQEEVVLVGSQANLFIDDFLIGCGANITRTLHQPTKDDGGNKPVLALDNEFGDLNATLEANGTIVFDPRLKKYVMFALGFCPEMRTAKPKPWDIVRIYRFTSVDGINWVKGDDGTPQRIFPRLKADLEDPASHTYATNIDLFSCYYDKNDGEFPYKGWLYFQNWGADREGIYYVKSPDGINWERGRQVAIGFGDFGYQTIYQDGRSLVGPADVSVFYYDEQENRFLGIFKFYSPNATENGNKLRSRAYLFCPPPLDTPIDIKRITQVELLPPAAEENNDHPHDEYYGSTGWRYESLWLGGLKIWHGEGDHPWSAAGCAYLKLICSRDGLDWSKVPYTNADGYPEVFIANGREGGNQGKNDGGYLTEFSQEPLRINDQLIFYYGCSSYGKNNPDSLRVGGGGIFRARLRVDGFVSVDAGKFSTRLLRFDGDSLFVNAIGPLTVEVLNEKDDLLGKQEISGDSVRHAVTFNGKDLKNIVRGNTARFRFTIEEKGKLYAFKIL